MEWSEESLLLLLLLRGVEGRTKPKVLLSFFLSTLRTYGNGPEGRKGEREEKGEKKKKKASSARFLSKAVSPPARSPDPLARSQREESYLTSTIIIKAPLPPSLPSPFSHPPPLSFPESQAIPTYLLLLQPTPKMKGGWRSGREEKKKHLKIAFSRLSPPPLLLFSCTYEKSTQQSRARQKVKAGRKEGQRTEGGRRKKED